MMGIFRMLGIDEEQVKKVIERVEEAERRVKRIEDKIDMLILMIADIKNEIEREGEENE